MSDNLNKSTLQPSSLAHQEDEQLPTSKISQIIRQTRQAADDKMISEISLQIQGENIMDKKRKASSTLRGSTKQHLKQLPQSAYNAYYNFMKDYNMGNNRDNNDKRQQFNEGNQPMIKANAIADTRRERNSLILTSNSANKPLFIPKISQDYQNYSIAMTPILQRTNLNKTTPEGTTATDPLKASFDPDTQKRKESTILQQTMDYKEAFTLPKPLNQSSLDNYNQNFQDTMTNNHIQRENDETLLPFVIPSKANSKRQKQTRNSLMPLTNEHLKSVKNVGSTALKQLPILTDRSQSVMAYGENGLGGKNLVRINKNGNNLALYRIGKSRNSHVLTGNSGYDDQVQHHIKTQKESIANRHLLKSYKETMFDVKQQTMKYHYSTEKLGIEDSNLKEEHSTSLNDDSYFFQDYQNSFQPPLSSLLTQNMYQEKLKTRKLKAISRKIDIKEMEIEEKLKNQVQTKWQYQEQKECSKQEIGIYIEAMLSLIGYLNTKELPHDEEISSILQRVVKGVTQQQSSQEKGFSLIISDMNQEMENMKCQILSYEKRVEELKSQLIEESKMFNDESKAYLEKRVHNFLNQGPQKFLVEPLVENREDDVSENLRQLTSNEIKNQLFQVFEKLRYSGAKDDLDHVFTILNFYQGVRKEILQENQRITRNEDEMSNNQFILQALKEDFGGTLKFTQTETARKVLQRYYKNITTNDVHVQTMPEESYIRELERQISDKDDKIKSCNESLFTLSTSNENLHLRLTLEANKAEHLTHQLKGKSMQFEELDEKYKVLDKEMAVLKETNQDLDQQRYDFKKQAETLREERTKLKLQMIMQKNQMIRDIDTLSKQNTAIKEEAAAAQLNNSNPLRGSYQTNLSVQKGESSIIDESESNYRSSRMDARMSREGAEQNSVQSVQLGSNRIDSREENPNPRNATQINVNNQKQLRNQDIRNPSQGQAINIKETEFSSPDHQSPDMKLKPQYETKSKVQKLQQQKGKQQGSDSNQRIAIALEKARKEVEPGIFKNDQIQKSNSRERDSEVINAYGQFTINGGTPQMTKINAKVKVESVSPQRKPANNLPGFNATTTTEDQQTQNSIMRSSAADLKTILLSETNQYPMLHIYQKPLVTLKKYKKELEDTDNLLNLFIANQRGSVSLLNKNQGVEVYVQTENSPITTARRRQITKSKSPQLLKPLSITMATQTRLTGEVKPIVPEASFNIQCEALDIDREAEREMLMIMNMEKLYGGRQQLLKQYMSRQSQGYSPVTRRAVGGGIGNESSVLGGSLDRQKYKFFDNQAHFSTEKLSQ